MSYILPYKNGFRAFAVLKTGKRPTKTFLLPRGARGLQSEMKRLHAEAERWLLEVEGGEVTPDTITFEQLFEEWLPVALSKLSNEGHKRNVEQSMRDYVLPALGRVPVREHTRLQLVQIVKQVAAMGKIETAGRVGQRICTMLSYAVDNGYIESHKAAGLSRVLPKKHVKPQNAITPQELPQLLRDINGYGDPVTRIGLLLLAHTFVRTNELVRMRRKEVNFKERIWVIPEERMKKDKPHVVPLSTQVLDLLKELDTHTGESDFYLESGVKTGKPISTNTMLFALYKMGYRGRMTGHGFRALASTILNSAMQFHPDAIERQLAHKETDKVRAAYNRAEHSEERIRMMQWYSDYLASILLEQQT